MATKTKKTNNAAPYVYNACGHRLISYRLSYLAFFEECARRYRKGEHQGKCPECGLFVFQDEARDRGHAEFIDRIPI